MTPAEQAQAWAARHARAPGAWRTTLRRDDVDVWTSWLPGVKCYETVVITSSSVVVAAMALAQIPLVRWCDAASDAAPQHEVVVAMLTTLLAVMAASAGDSPGDGAHSDAGDT